MSNGSKVIVLTNKQPDTPTNEHHRRTENMSPRYAIATWVVLKALW